MYTVHICKSHPLIYTIIHTHSNCYEHIVTNISYFSEEQNRLFFHLLRKTEVIFYFTIFAKYENEQSRANPSTHLYPPNQYSGVHIKIPLTGDSYFYVDKICTFSEYFRR